LKGAVAIGCHILKSMRRSPVYALIWISPERLLSKTRHASEIRRNS
jgi:hypothetical protein